MMPAISIDRISVLFGQDLNDSPELINESPYQDGWFVKIQIKDPSEHENLLDIDEYKALVDES